MSAKVEYVRPQRRRPKTVKSPTVPLTVAPVARPLVPHLTPYWLAIDVLGVLPCSLIDIVEMYATPTKEEAVGAAIHHYIDAMHVSGEMHEIVNTDSCYLGFTKVNYKAKSRRMATKSTFSLSYRRTKFDWRGHPYVASFYCTVSPQTLIQALNCGYWPSHLETSIRFETFANDDSLPIEAADLHAILKKFGISNV